MNSMHRQGSVGAETRLKVSFLSLTIGQLAAKSAGASPRLSGAFLPPLCLFSLSLTFQLFFARVSILLSILLLGTLNPVVLAEV